MSLTPPVSPSQCVREPVSAADATVGERVVARRHLPVHVSPLPHPLRGAPTGMCAARSFQSQEKSDCVVFEHHSEVFLALVEIRELVWKFSSAEGNETTIHLVA